MFARVHTGPRGHQRRRLGVEPLEGRDVPAAAVDPLTTFGGTVDAPHRPGWVQMQVQTSDRALLAFESDPAAGSALRAGPLKVFAGEGSAAKVVGLPRGHGFALATVDSGIHFARATGAGGSTGAFDLVVSLAGDVDGDHQVNSQDLDGIRGLRGVRAGQEGYVPAADVNHNGVIGIGDLRLARRNLGRSAVVGPVTADQFLFDQAGAPALATRAGPRLVQYNPRTSAKHTLVVPGINDPAHPIDLDGWIWEVQKGPATPAISLDATLGMPTSEFSPKLFQAVVNGTVFTDAALFSGRVGVGLGAQPRFRWDMGGARFTSYNSSAFLDGGKTLEDLVHVSFSKLKITFVPRRPDGTAGGSVSYGWDFATNQPWNPT